MFLEQHEPYAEAKRVKPIKAYIYVFIKNRENYSVFGSEYFILKIFR